MANWNNTFNTSPADGADLSEGAARIRETRLETENRLGVDHNMGPGADEESGGLPGRHMQGSALAFTTSGASGPTKLNSVTQAMPVTDDGTSTTTLGTKDQGRLWLNEGGQLLYWSGTAWVLVNNLDPTATTGQFGTALSTVTTTPVVTPTAHNYIEITSGVDMEIDVTIPDQGLWMVEVEASIPFNLQTGDGNGALAIEIIEDPLGATGGPVVTTNWLGVVAVGGSQGLTGTVTMTAYDVAPTLGDVYRAKIGVVHSKNPGPTYGDVTLAGVTAHAQLTVKVLPYGA